MRIINWAVTQFKNIKLFKIISVSGLICFSFIYQANADKLSTNVQIRVTVYGEPECTLGGASSMSVDFGDVHQALIDGSYKKLPINYNLICDNRYKNSLKMSLSWTNREINGQSSVFTNLPDLGIAIYQGNTRLSNGSILNFTYGNSPVLYAVPVKPSGKNLVTGGDFTGNITMKLDYQ